MKKYILIGLLTVLSLVTFAPGAVYTVDAGGTGNYFTIQGAISNPLVVNGDEIIVAPGTYTENIDFLGKAITVRSGDITTPSNPNTDAVNTIISGTGLQGSGTVVTFQTNEDANSVLKGFTIRNGWNNFGGGISCSSASPTISDCVITMNNADYGGGGIDCYFASPRIINCEISNNTAWDFGSGVIGYGGGINCENSAPTIEFCLINSNNSVDVGGGISSIDSSALIKSCAIANNQATDVGGAIYLSNSAAEITNCTITNNTGLNNYGGIYSDATGYKPAIINTILWNNGDELYGCSATYSCIEDNDSGQGNIHADPNLIADTAGLHYYLSRNANGLQKVDSPCIGAGYGSVSSLGTASYTNRTDYMPQTGPVDIGYYRTVPAGSVPQFTLTGSAGTNGSINPDGVSSRNQFEVVKVTAAPATGYEAIWNIAPAANGSTVPSDSNSRYIAMNSNTVVGVNFQTIQRRTLTIVVNLPGGRLVSPAARTTHNDGDVVTIIAEPEHSYFTRWSNTDNDASTQLTNTVTMTSNKTVTISFVQPNTIHVPGGYPYITIQDAIDQAVNGDIIQIAPGTYPGSGFYVNKSITIVGYPEDPNMVVIDGNNFSNRIFYLDGSRGAVIMLNGLTIANANYHRPTPLVGSEAPWDPNHFRHDGGSGMPAQGAGIYARGDHTIINCIVRNCTGAGGNGRNGVDGNPWDLSAEPKEVPIHKGGYGGRGGNAEGGGIYIRSGKPIIQNTIVEGCAVIGGKGGNGGNGLDASTSDPCDPNYPGGPGGNGGNGGDALGAGIYCNQGAKPTFINSIIRDCEAITGSGGDGGLGGIGARNDMVAYDPCDANSIVQRGYGQGGHGGVPGMAYGGGIYIDNQCTATFNDCNITGNSAQGNLGGCGGNSGWSDTGGGGWWQGGLGGLVDIDTLNRVIANAIRDVNDPCNGGIDPNNLILPNQISLVGNFTSGMTAAQIQAQIIPIRPEVYTAKGGGVYINSSNGSSTTADFNDCEIKNNWTKGSTSGMGGYNSGKQIGYRNASYESPTNHYRVPSFGNGVYLSDDSRTTFLSCNVENNYYTIEDTNNVFLLAHDQFIDLTQTPPVIAGHPGTETTVPRPKTFNPPYTYPYTYRLIYGDEYLCYGGGLCFDSLTGSATQTTITDCNISGNKTAMGGGIYAQNMTTFNLVDCNLADNSAHLGGGLFSIDNIASQVDGCTFTGNMADSTVSHDSNNNGVLGQGGGIFSYATGADIFDSAFENNNATGSGGGLYIGGISKTSEPALTNCLITGNTAGIDGGGISVNWFADVAISNCTIADNKTNNIDAFGGGIHASYASKVTVGDTIFWNNIGVNGSQIAITSGDPFWTMFSSVNVTYSDVDMRTTAAFNSSGSSGSGTSGFTSGSLLVDEDAINAALDANGVAKVIVSLVEPAAAGSINWDSTLSVTAMRNEIANLQSTVLATLTPAEFTVRHQLENAAIFSGEITRTGLTKLFSNPAVVHIEPVRYVKPALAQAIPLANALIPRQTYNGTGIAIAIVDSGVDYTHPRLGDGGFPNSKVIGGYDYGDDDNDPMPLNVAHGTCTSGIAAGNLGTVGDYIGGVAYNAKIYALKLTTDEGLWPTDSDLAAWDWCLTHRNDDPANPLKIISNSWGIPSNHFNDPAKADAFSPAHTTTAAQIVSAGITILAASGNEYQTDGISWPAAMSDVISVGAVYDTTDKVTEYSNTDEILDILAPADPIYTTDIVGAAGYDPGDYYPYFNGTSAATPFAAGCVADIQSAARTELGGFLSPGAIRQLLTSTGDPVTDTKIAITKPRVNLGAAIAAMAPSTPIYVETARDSYINWDPNTGWSPTSHNIDDDPNFIAGYYLDYSETGQDANSPCFDIGSDLASVLGMDIFTTRIDGANDTDIVDLGYHYIDGPTRYQLITDANGDGNFEIPWQSGTYTAYENMQIDLVAVPDVNHRVVRWTITKDSGTTILETRDRQYSFTMTGDTTVRVDFEFYEPRSIIVPDEYATVQEAVDAAEDGDTIYIYKKPDGSPHYITSPDGIDLKGKAITISSANPDDPNVVAETVIDCNGLGRAFIFRNNEDANTVIAGLTIINGFVSVTSGGNCAVHDPCSAPEDGAAGEDAIGNGYGGAMYFDTNTSPLIYNCVISNCTAAGGRGGDGCDGQNTYPDSPTRKAGNGGNSGNGYGNGYGGAMYFNVSSAPVIKGCTLKNNTAQGGTGGNGGNGGEAIGSDSADDAGIPGRGGNGQGNGYGGAIYAEPGSAPVIIDSTIKENTARMGIGGIGGLSHSLWRWYATDGLSVGLGYGGAAYYRTSSAIDVNNCQFIKNDAKSENADFTAGAGAIYCEPNAVAINFNGTTFTGNTANGNGGAMIIGCQNNPVFTNCLFGGNVTDRSGGAVFLDNSELQNVEHSNLKFTDCVFTDNTAVDFGGAVSTENCSITFTDCYINRNSAGSGGGIYATADTILNITGGTISGNSATGQYGSGGGVAAINIPLTITNCLISNNTAAYSAGGILFKGPETTSSAIHNCLFVKNSAGNQGGAITFNLNTSPTIASCTFSENSVAIGGSGGTLYLTYNSSPAIMDSIFYKSSRIAIYENTPDCDTNLSFCLFYQNYNGDYYQGSTARTYKTYNPDDPTNPADPNASELAALKAATSATNDAKNPLFVSGDLGDYYLSQIAAGDPNNSPAWNAGSADANSVAVLTGETMADYTTRTDSLGAAATGDVNTLDIGYHYIDLDNARQFSLSTSVSGGYGTILPGSGLYYAGQTVKLTASPQSGWRIDAWTGSDNDSSADTVNYLVMVADKVVTVAFRQPDNLFVPGEFTNIQDAIEASKDGDRIVITADTYNAYGTSRDRNVLVIDGKAITLTGTNPDDPNVVAATHIIGRIKLSNVGRDTVIDGITITGNYSIFNGWDGCTSPHNEHEDGMNGGSIDGGGMKLFGDASPTIRNVRFVNCSVRAGNGGKGGCENGDGGWGGWAHGGAVSIGPGGSPIFKNCLFSGNEVFPGNGGDAVADSTGHGGSWGVPDDPRWFYADGLGKNGGYMDYWKYSGYGGAVYCEVNSKPEFEDCTFTGNLSHGGVSGRTEPKLVPGYPERHYRIDRFGGAVYIAADSTPVFTRCEFNGNQADPNGPIDPNDEFLASADQHIAFGGAVAGEESAMPTFKDCTFKGNIAGLGGAMYWIDSTAFMEKSHFISNTAGHGGAIFITDSNIVMMGCDLTSNEATGPMGQGGALASDASAPWIIDSKFSTNKASASGGGLYFAGEGDPNMKNCLIVRNAADRDGGGISANWDTQLTIGNCTIADNIVTGDGFTSGFGGGLSSAYEANVNIIDSIIWGNSADVGKQVSIGSTFDSADQKAAEVSVTYSDVANGGTSIFVDGEHLCILNWDPNTNLTGTSLSFPWFISGPMGNYYLSQLNAYEPNYPQSQQSPCVDSGSENAHDLNFWQKHTTRTDNVPDTGTVDMGYHYTLSSDLKGDFNYDGVVDIIDLAILIDTDLHWFEQDCEFPYWCHDKDLNTDSVVDYADFAEFARNYMKEETTPPNPNPMTWQRSPISNSGGTITMVATFATDNSGAKVEYYFECVYGSGHNRGWDSTRTYTDTGLTDSIEYGYRVKARDRSGPPENETEWSIIGYAIPGEDVNAPVPNPMTWALEPMAVSPNSIQMVATTATDAGGVRYYFSNIVDTGDPNSGLGHDSGWQDSPYYIDNGLDPNTTYAYTVKARDTSGNTTGSSVQRSATTLAPNAQPVIDTNAPVFDTEPNSTSWPWEIAPRFINYGTIDNPEWHCEMSAPATDAEGSDPVWYNFECYQEGSGLDSGWITTSAYTTSRYYFTQQAPFLYFRVKAKDNAGNETGWSKWWDTSSGEIP